MLVYRLSHRIGQCNNYCMQSILLIDFFVLLASSSFCLVFVWQFKSLRLAPEFSGRQQLQIDRPFTLQGIKNWRSDEEFGNQRLAGCNPAVIELCRSIPEK